MNFEEIKVIWDTQNDEPLYAINQEALHSRIRKDAKLTARSLNLLEIISILLMLTMGTAVGTEPIIDHHDYHQWIHTIIYYSIAIWIYRQRRARLKVGEQFNNTLLGDLNHSLSTIDSHIERCRGFTYWVLGPICLIAVASFPFYYDSKPFWIWPMLLLCFIASYHSCRYTIRKHLEPQKRSLNALKERLIQSEDAP